MIKRALISVSDKTGILEFAQFLDSKGVEILSTGGTAKLLADNGVKVQEVSDYTGFPEMMDGRVKTLHPMIHGGLLAVRDEASHMEQAEANEIGMIDMVVVNLYPFAETLANPESTHEQIVEQIDIGGPSMLRSAAKNYKSVSVITDPDDYLVAQEQIEASGDTTEEFRAELAAKVFIATTQYDAMIANYFYPEFSAMFLEKQQELRYGENPHQAASFYREPGNEMPNVTNAAQHQGKELSYNNIMDADLAFELVKEFEDPAVAIIKHAVPCGVAIGESVFEAYNKAYAVDTKSPFGGIVAMNRECDKQTAEKLNEIFLEIVIAPRFTEEALEVFAQKENLRVLETGGIDTQPGELTFKKVSGGLLVQEKNQGQVKVEDLKLVSSREVSEQEQKDMVFAWKVIKHVKSNAIVLAKDGVTVGVGAGQTARVDSVEIACKKAGEQAKGAVMASDAFFPFADGVEAAAPFGISAVVHPGGSVRDNEVEEKVNELGLGMMYCGQRAFLH